MPTTHQLLLSAVNRSIQEVLDELHLKQSAHIPRKNGKGRGCHPGQRAIQRYPDQDIGWLTIDTRSMELFIQTVGYHHTIQLNDPKAFHELKRCIMELNILHKIRNRASSSPTT